MKIFFTLLAAVLLTASVLAQSPEKMSYQAVIRNSSDVLVTDTQVGMQISIIQGTADGSSVYTETQTPTTNANGLVSIEIGDGTVVSGDFTTIDWTNGPYFIKIETDPAGGTSYTITGTSQLLSVPYALHAKTAETAAESDPLFTSWDKTTGISITESQISDLGTYIETETDPLFTDWDKSTDITITESQISDLNHFQTSDETDPVFTAWDRNYADLTNTPTTITTEQANAIVANTAKVGITTEQTTKLAGIAEGAEVNVNADWNATSGDAQILNKPTIPAAADGSETKVTAGTNVTVTGSGTAASPYVVNSTAGSGTLAIGDSYQGGIIFWLDATGQHGLIAATTDQSTGIQWYNGAFTFTTAFASAVGAGYGNTRMIVYNQGAGDYAAQLCRDLSLGGYYDWYLPSKYELNLMYQNIGQGNLLGLGNVGAFASAYYWSSTESSRYYAWYQLFTNGWQNHPALSTSTARVRAVRAF